jgi:hypothetical protein
VGRPRRFRRADARGVLAAGDADVGLDSLLAGTLKKEREREREEGER